MTLTDALIARRALPSERGPRGPKGPKGDQGAGGDPGARGPKGEAGKNGKDGTSVRRAQAETLPPGSEATADFHPTTGLLKLGIPRGEKGEPGVSRLGGGGGGGRHPNLAAHDTLGLATQVELDAHVATPHGGGSTSFIGIDKWVSPSG